MTIAMDFRGKLVFRNKSELATALDAFEKAGSLADDACVEREDLDVKGLTVALETNGSGPASGFDATVDLVKKTLAPLASEGEVVARCEGERPKKIKAKAQFAKAANLVASVLKAAAERGPSREEIAAQNRAESDARNADWSLERVRAVLLEKLAPMLAKHGHAFVRETAQTDSKTALAGEWPKPAVTFAKKLAGGLESVLLVRQSVDAHSFAIYWYVGGPLATPLHELGQYSLWQSALAWPSGSGRELDACSAALVANVEKALLEIAPGTELETFQARKKR